LIESFIDPRISPVTTAAINSSSANPIASASAEKKERRRLRPGHEKPF